MRKRICFDFDGVIHSYTSGWQGIDIIPDPPVEGIKETLKILSDMDYIICITSTRCSSRYGVMAIWDWLEKYGLAVYVGEIRRDKPPAYVYVDDRAICFDGISGQSLVDKIVNFKTWME